jgi:hypothetical protein
LHRFLISWNHGLDFLTGFGFDPAASFAQSLCITTSFSNFVVKPGDITEGWATYFERLSKSLECPDFNEEYKQFVEAGYDQILEYCSV